MSRRFQCTLLAGAVLAAAACSGNPMPGDRGYPHNLTGIYDSTFETMGVEYSGPAEIATSPGGLVYGKVELGVPEEIVGDLSGSIVGDTLRFESSYERAGGCVGMLSGEGVIAEGGGSVVGEAVVDDDCAGDTVDATFKMTRQAE